MLLMRLVRASLAKLRSPNGAAARTAPASHHWRIMLIEFLANVGGAGDIITLGDWQPQTTLEVVPGMRLNYTQSR